MGLKELTVGFLVMALTFWLLVTYVTPVIQHGTEKLGRALVNSHSENICVLLTPELKPYKELTVPKKDLEEQRTIEVCTSVTVLGTPQ